MPSRGFSAPLRRDDSPTHTVLGRIACAFIRFVLWALSIICERAAEVLDVVAKMSSILSHAFLDLASSHALFCRNR